MRAEVNTETINAETVTKTYARWAPVYDLVFGTVFERARHAAIAATNRVGGRVLDVGVGTGICLPHYAPTTRVVGIDLSEPMLRKARKRVAEQGLQHVERLEVMDAERLAFPEASFDVVVAQYVVNTVPHPEVALDEFARVLKPGGEIVLINRVGAEDGPRRTLRAPVHARDAAARLAVRLSLGALRALGRRDRTACASSSAARCRRSATSR